MILKVAIVYGSKSDKNVMKGASDALKEYDVQCHEFVISAHRNPKLLIQTIEEFELESYECIIAGAGLSAHLAGFIASHTVIPVIGVPIDVSLGGLDSLLSIVQMPKPIPVAVVGIDNSFNAGILAVQMLSIKYPILKQALKRKRTEG